MKSLRAKLFINIGVILLLTAILNTMIAEKWIKKELAQAGTKINEQVDESQKKIRQFVSFLLTFQIVKEAAELERISQSSSFNLPSSPSSLWEDAQTVIAYNPSISFVQIQNNQGETAVIAPQNALLHSFSWAFEKEGFLWVKLIDQTALFVAILQELNEETLYLLFDKEQLNATSKEQLSSLQSPFKEKLLLAKQTSLPQHPLFTSVQTVSKSYNWKDSATHLFETLLAYQNQWLEKIELICALASWQETIPPISPIGALKIDKQAETGLCLLTKDLLSSRPLLENLSNQNSFPKVPFLFLRQTPEGEDLDMVQITSFSNQEEKTMTLGFSLSSLLQQISLLIQKTVIASGEGMSVGFTPDGKKFNPQKEQFPFNQEQGENAFISWNNQSYFSSTIDLDVFKLFVLTPQEQALSMTHFLQNLGEEITFKISLSLLAAALFSFAIALLLLQNISKKITTPISILSKASEELSKGNYEGLILPKLGYRKDEVSTLSHSFEGLVNSLRDKDKIRGVLNKVVSKEISEQILKHNIELGGEEKVLTLLFSDIRNFTKLAEGLPPHILIEILNAYMTRMCRIIDATHGVVDKFVGDEIMTLYGAPLDLDFHAVKAIKAALWMIQDLSKWNEERRQKQVPVFEIGIGIHTGLVYTGNMGAENRLNYTAIGSNVNQASRICAFAKPMQILISEDTFQMPGVQETFLFQKLEPALLKGIELPVQIYEVKGFLTVDTKGSTTGS